MALSKFLKKSSAQQEPARPVAGQAGQTGGKGLAGLLGQGITLPADRTEMLSEGFKKGLEFFEDFNESRLRLAFSSFDEDMKKALFEVLFLIHVNDPKFVELSYTANDVEHKGGVVSLVPRETVADLYVEDAPYGVEGIAALSPVFKEEFEAHIRETFQMEVPPGSGFGYCPIKSIHSLGSIGTVGHKSRTSDLDLQVQ